jgi:hypothetical protein
MAAQTLRDCERQTLEHLQRAQERGATLRDYAAQWGVNVERSRALQRQSAPAAQGFLADEEHEACAAGAAGRAG